MKTFTFIKGRINPGLAVTSDPTLGDIISLGEEGPGRRCQKVGLCRKTLGLRPTTSGPPNHRILTNAHPIEITIARGTDRELKLYLLAKPRGPDPRALVRVSTKWICTRNTHGHFRPHKGDPKTLAVGYGAHGTAGPIATWKDALVIMAPKDILWVRPEGGHKTRPWALIHTGGAVEAMTWADFETANAEDQGETAPL